LGEIGTIFGGLTGKSKTDFINGNSRYVSYVNVFNNLAVDTKKNDFVKVEPNERQRTLQQGDIIFTGSSETSEEVGMSSVVTNEIDEPIYLNSFCIGYRLADTNIIDPEFSKHLFRSEELRKQIVRTASGVTRFNVSKSRLAQVKIPILDLTEQKRIANILDKFDALVNDLSSGLPAEIKARRQQYEHYRDRLLTFKEAA
jgi:type I restriction enzyme S subunit